MSASKKCPKCGATIAHGWKHELCPACLMSVGFPTGDSARDSAPVSASDETKASENTYAPPPNAPLSVEEVRKLFPQLEIIEQIGRGGMGVVYKARQPQLDRLVALKILSVAPGSSGEHSSFAERFSREARALARLNHPNIVSVFDFGQAGDLFYFIMEFVDGANLRQMIASKQMSPEQALAIVPRVCEALQFAHEEGILHRDIKPENILIDKKGRVKIADFGLAKLVDDQTVDHSLTGTHQVMGTPRYMAPEQFENTKTVDHRADIYSLGVVFYEMLTGEIPMGRFAPPSKKVQVDVRLDEVVLRSLEKEPELRYQHASEIKSDVEDITQHGARPVPDGGKPVRGPLAGAHRPASPPPATAAEPRLSRTALVGIIWAPFTLVGWPIWQMCIRQYFDNPARFESYSTSYVIVCVILCVLAATAWIGSTILGGVAIAQIKRSGGRLHGLPLAAAALLVHPLGALGVLTGLAAALLVALVVGTGLDRGIGPGEIGLIALPVAALVCFLTARAAWRRISSKVPTIGSSGRADFQSLETIASRLANRSLLFLGIGLAAGLVVFVLTSNFAFRLGLVHPGEGDLPPRLRPAFFACLPVALAMTILGTAYGWRAVLRARTLEGSLGLRLRAFIGAVLVPVLAADILLAAGFDGLIAFLGGLWHWDYQTKTGLWMVLAPLGAVALTIWLVRALWRTLFPRTPPVSTAPPATEGSTSSAQPLDHRVSEVVTKGIPGWFNARAKWVQALVQGVLMIIFLIGLLAFMGFSFKASSGPGQSEQVIAFGMPAPWLEIANGTMNFEWMIHPFAPSVVLALLGAAAALLYEKIRRSRPGFDAAKDRRTTRRWVIAMGLVVAAIITAAVSLTMKKPVSSMYTAVITEDASANEGAASGVHRMFRYNVSAPADHRVTFWVEYWREGKLEKKAGLTGGQMIQLPSRAPFEGGFDFSLADGSKTNPDAAGKVRWDFFVSSRLRDWTSSNGVMKVNDDAGRGGHGNWIADPFAGLDVVSSWGKTRKWNVAIGEPVTVLVLRGYATGENLAVGLSDEDAKKGKATILVRARFDAVPPGERVEHARTVSLNAEDVEKLGVPTPKPAAVGKPATIREDAKGVATNKLFRDFGYRVAASANQRATFWVELWRDGELQRAAGTTAGQSYDPPRGKHFDGRFIFSMFDAAEWGPGAGGQAMWDFTSESPLFDGPHASYVTKFKPARTDALGAYRKWIGNPFEDLEVRTSWGSKKSWTTIGGEPVTLLMLTGDPAGKAPDAVTDEAAAKRSKVCLLLKVRFDYVRPENLKDASVTRYLSADDLDPHGRPAVVPTTDSRFVIAQDRAHVPATKTEGREEFAFTLSGPTGYVANVWMEVWQNGRMELVRDFDYLAYPKAGEPFAASLSLTMVAGNASRVESDGKTRLDWAIYSGETNANGLISGASFTNFFKSMGAVHHSWDRDPRKWNPRPGEAVTILSITGYAISGFRSALSVFTEADLIKGWPDAAIIVRAQFVPAKPGEIRDGEGPGVGIYAQQKGIGEGRITFAQFEIAKQIGVDVSRCQMPAEAHAVLVAAASTEEGQEGTVKMIGEFLSEVGYSTSNPDKRFVIEPMKALWWRARKGQTVSAEELVTVLERFIEDLNTGVRGVWWNRPEPIIKGENGPELSDTTAKLLKLTKPQHEEANKILQKYAQEARALERRNTKITKNEQGHVLVTISHYSTQCLALASNMVAELGGIVPQNILPAIRPGGLPAVVFGSAGECRTEIEMWKEDGKYHLNVRSRDWLPAPGMSRSDSSFSNVGPGIGTFYGDYRLYWTEE